MGYLVSTSQGGGGSSSVVETVVERTTDQTVSTATMTDDDTLQIPLTPGDWIFELHAFLQKTAGVADLKFTIVDDGAEEFIYTWYSGSDTTFDSGHETTGDNPVTPSLSGAANIAVHIFGRVKQPDPDTLKFRFARVGASGSVINFTGSYVRARKVA